MTHNDVARRTARAMPARSLTPRPLACEGAVVDGIPGLRALVRALPGRVLDRTCEGGRLGGSGR
ncbi:hypothetical protein ACFWA9_02450 [Kitasatospora sp. NPDC059973]|uniref:hypothetical protein n=1 Tax=Kitasatospora sp. NPDC059973 TaxID=3347020 RepID=UPI0036AC207B